MHANPRVVVGRPSLLHPEQNFYFSSYFSSVLMPFFPCNLLPRNLFSLFFSPMESQAGCLMEPGSTTSTGLFLLALRGWGYDFLSSEPDPDPSKFLEEVQVTCILHNKMPASPEHEFLVIETKDREGFVRPLILERTVRLQGDQDSADLESAQNTAPGQGARKLFERFQQIYRTMLPPGPESSEEGSSLLPQTSPTASALSLVDRLTTSSALSADLISQPLYSKLFKEVRDTPAIDRFLGQDYVFSAEWQGQNIRHLKPGRPLSLFEFAILAEAVHSKFPLYSLLREQCYFFAGAVYSAVLHEFGADSEGPSGGLPQKYGRWGGALVSLVPDAVVLEIVAEYRAKRDSEILKVGSFATATAVAIANETPARSLGEIRALP